MNGQENQKKKSSGAARRLKWRLAAIISSGIVVVLAAAAGTYAIVRNQTSSKFAAVEVAAPGSALIARHRHKPSPRPTATKAPSPSPSASHPSPTPPPKTTAACGGPASNTPGGPDPWGGCWPGSANTGVPSGTSLSAYSGPCEIRQTTVISGKTVNCDLALDSGNLTLDDSMVNGTVYNNGSGSVLIEHTTMNGGSEETETVGGSNLTLLYANLYGNQHEVYCDGNCTVENSYLHDNYNFGVADHENGFLSTGGSGYDLYHNSVYCVGGCTGDITFIPNDNVSSASVSKNLLVASPDAAYCLYPSSDPPAKPGIVEEMTITDNVFQHGPDGTCASYGPVYGWDTPTSTPGTDGYRNVWSGNTWDNGQALNPP
jgi:hypothetical protein